MKNAALSLALCALAACGPSLDREAAVRHLAENRERFEAVRAEVVSSLPPGHRVDIELREGEAFDFAVHVPEPPGRTGDRSVIAWSVDEDDPDVARGLAMLGWTPADLRRVREHIVALDGIGLEAPTQNGGIGLLYRRADDGWYTFFVTDSAAVSPERVGFDGCASHWVDTRAGLVFASGAVGPVCVPGGDVTARY